MRINQGVLVMSKPLIAVALALAVLPQSLFAQTTAPASSPAAIPMPPELARMAAACGADVKKYCLHAAVKSTMTSEERSGQIQKMNECMAAHEAEFSTACQEATAALEAFNTATQGSQPTIKP